MASRTFATIEGLPTWVPDFSTQVAGKAEGPNGIGFHPSHPHSVSGPGAGADNGRTMEDGQTLRVEVLPVDVVQDVLLLDDDVSKALTRLTVIENLVSIAKTRTIINERLLLYYEKYRSAEPLWRVLISNKRFNYGYDLAPQTYEVQYQKLKARPMENEGESYLTPNMGNLDKEYVNALRQHLLGRAFFTTQNGLFGLAVPSIRPGDDITIWFGATVPFVIRHQSEYCQLVGA